MLKPLKDAIFMLGGQTETAKKLGISPRTVSAWVNRLKKTPVRHVITLEKLTNNKINRHQLRPDIYPL